MELENLAMLFGKSSTLDKMFDRCCLVECKGAIGLFVVYASLLCVLLSTVVSTFFVVCRFVSFNQYQLFTIHTTDVLII